MTKISTHPHTPTYIYVFINFYHVSFAYFVCEVYRQIYSGTRANIIFCIKIIFTGMHIISFYKLPDIILIISHWYVVVLFSEINDLIHPNKNIPKSFPSQWPTANFGALCLGDHVCYYQFPYYRHGIVTEKHCKSQTVKLLRYHISRGEIDEEEIKCTNSQFYVLDKASRRKVNLVKARYSGPCFKSDTVVQRALARCKEKQYDPITNFARAFPRWCKTGKGGLTAINQIELNEGREVIKRIQVLVKGDHIMFDRGSYSHHAIVLAVNPLENKIEVIHFTPGQHRKGEIKREVITRHEQPGTLFRLTYRALTESTPDHVVLRAILIEQKGLDYNLIGRNCEHLVTWCKTGIWDSGQVKNLAVYAWRQFFSFGIKISSQVLVRVISESFASLVDIFASFYVKLWGKQVDLISCMIYCITDIAWNIYDVRKKYKNGELQGEALHDEIIKRVVRCLVVDSSVVLGNIIGQIFIPAPTLGAFIGGLCGLALGELINFLIQKIVAILKSQKAKMFWEKSIERLHNSPSDLREMLREFPCSSHSDFSCICAA